MAMYRMTPARKAALRKAQIASARKRKKGLKNKAKIYASTYKAKRSANKTLRSEGIKSIRRNNKVNRLSRRSTRARIKANALRTKASSLDSKARRLKQKSNRVANGTQSSYRKRRAAVRKARRAQAWGRKK